MNAIENKIPNVSSLVKKTDYDAKIYEMEKKLTDHDHDKYITTPELNKITAEIFAPRLTQANLVTKTDFDNKLIDFNKKINSNKTKHLLVENELLKLQVFDSSYFGKSHFEEDCAQNYLVFQPMCIYFKKISGVGIDSYIYIYIHIYIYIYIYTIGNLKVCLMKGLTLVLPLVIVLLQN